jgi:small subunit ribosomal protein S2
MNLKKNSEITSDLTSTLAHMGHKRDVLHPKFGKYVFGVKNRLVVINLDITADLLIEAGKFLYNIVSKGGRVLWVSTKASLREPIEQNAIKCGSYYVTNKWLSGSLTNFVTLISSLKRREMIKGKLEIDEKIPNKEKFKLQRALKRANTNLIGLQDMKNLPEVIILTDVNKDAAVVKEAMLKKIPIIALIDSDNDPTKVNFPIPMNNDSVKSVEYVVEYLANIIQEASIEAVSKFSKITTETANKFEKIAAEVA